MGYAIITGAVLFDLQYSIELNAYITIQENLIKVSSFTVLAAYMQFGYDLIRYGL